MKKQLTKKTLEALVGQDVSIEYEEMNTEEISIVSRVVAVDEKTISIQLNSGIKTISTLEIKKICGKNITFIQPKQHFDKKYGRRMNVQMDKINTQIIERMKKLPRYELSTRSAQFTKQSSKSVKKKDGYVKEKITQKVFESKVFNWIGKSRKPIQLCPLALLNNELLLIIEKKQFHLLDKNFGIVKEHKKINTIVKFIVEQNIKIRTT